MWILFDMGSPRILNVASTTDKLRFEEGTLPPHLAVVRSSRIESIEDPLFLGAQRLWPELKLRQLYTWLKLLPPLSPAKMSNETLIEFRKYIRAAIAKTLGLEPSKLPTLEACAGPVRNAPYVPPPPRPPNAQRGAVGPLIHRVATEMWTAAGSPRDVPVILVLRKTIMKVLNEEHGVKIDTASNELGRWQKQLLTS